MLPAFFITLACIVILIAALWVIGPLGVGIVAAVIGLIYAPIPTGIVLLIGLGLWLVVKALRISFALLWCAWFWFPYHHRNSFEHAARFDRDFGQQLVAVCRELQIVGVKKPATKIFRDVRTKLRNGHALGSPSEELAQWSSFERTTAIARRRHY